jgi:hypothetical protein
MMPIPFKPLSKRAKTWKPFCQSTDVVPQLEFHMHRLGHCLSVFWVYTPVIYMQSSQKNCLSYRVNAVCLRWGWTTICTIGNQIGVALGQGTHMPISLISKLVSLLTAATAFTHPNFGPCHTRITSSLSAIGTINCKAMWPWVLGWRLRSEYWKIRAQCLLVPLDYDTFPYCSFFSIHIDTTSSGPHCKKPSTIITQCLRVMRQTTVYLPSTIITR